MQARQGLGGASGLQLDMSNLDRLSCGRESEILSLPAALGKTESSASAGASRRLARDARGS
jgi:hypothetical protein